MRSNLNFNLALMTLCLSLSSCSDNGAQVQNPAVAAPSVETSTASAQPVEVGAPAIPVEASRAEKATGCADSKGIRPQVDLVMGKEQATNVLNIAFVGEQPPAEEIDRILRACIGAAVQVDPTRDILGTAWSRKSAQDNPLDDEIISNYGPLNYLSYQASTKNIEVRKMNFNSK